MTRFAVCILIISISVISGLAQARKRNTPALKNERPSKSAGAPTISDPTNLPPPPTPAQRAAEKAADKAAENMVVKVETNLVTTPVSVLDRNGRFIPGLTKKDFKIFEDDVPQAVTYFQSSESPFTVVLMIDTSPST